MKKYRHVCAAVTALLMLTHLTGCYTNHQTEQQTPSPNAFLSIEPIPNGLRLHFPSAADQDQLADPLNYTITQRPKDSDQPATTLTHLRPVPSDDGATVDLYIDGLQPAHVIHIRYVKPDIHDKAVRPIESSYTLKHIPQMDRTAEYYGAPPDDTHPWSQHDPLRPLPPMADPPPTGPVTTPPPDGAVVLFDGTDLGAWQKDATWIIENGEMHPAQDSGYIHTREDFGDLRLHLEWFCPESETKDQSQQRGNSGVFLMGLYEIQILETKDNITYADGMAAAIYGQTPPIVNAGLGPGKWQSYDITFHRPRFDDTGQLLQPARATVYHNGVLVQNNTPFEGPTTFKYRTKYVSHGDRLPIALQNHGDPVRFRNIWVQPLE